VAVGGTSLTLDSTSAWASESAWIDGGGGVSKYESQPAYQSSVVPQPITTTKRTTPDVAYDGDPNTGVAVYSSVNYYPYYPFTFFGHYSGWFQVGGTSAGAPQWSGIVALADQGRSTALGSSGTLTAVYQNSPTTLGAQTDFHDIASGSNGFNAVSGFDEATGVGTPKADQLVPVLSTATATATVTKASATTGGTSGGGTGKQRVTVVTVGPSVPVPVVPVTFVVTAQVSAPLPLVPAPGAPPAATLPLTAPASPAQPAAVALPLPAIAPQSQFAPSSTAGGTAEGAADPKGLSSGEMPAPAAPELTPGQDGRPSKRSDDVPPPAPSPGGAAAPAGDVDAFFADEGAVALLAGRDAVAVLAGEGDLPRVVGGSGFAAVGLAAMLGRCWMESEADRAAQRRRTQTRFPFLN
jgi:hypothetical protein